MRTNIVPIAPIASLEPRNNNQVGDSNGNSMVKDEKTGYMVATNKANVNSENHFSIERKLNFVELCKQHWPNIHKVLLEVGISYGTYKNHLLLDPKFNKDLEAIREAKVDQVEGNVFAFANRPANFMDRMAILRAYRGDLYNPVQKIQQVGAELTPQQAEARKINLATVVDAEVIAASTEVLDAEIVDPAPQSNTAPLADKLQVPGSISPAQSPAGKSPRTRVRFATPEAAPTSSGPDVRSRDPLSEITDI